MSDPTVKETHRNNSKHPELHDGYIQKRIETCTETSENSAKRRLESMCTIHSDTSLLLALTFAPFQFYLLMMRLAPLGSAMPLVDLVPSVRGIVSI